MEKEIEKLEEYKVWKKLQDKDNSKRDKIFNNLTEKLLPYYQKKLTGNWFKEEKENEILHIQKVYSIKGKSKNPIEDSDICLDFTLFKKNSGKEICFLYTANYEKGHMFLFQVEELTKIDIDEINRSQDSILKFIQNSLDLTPVKLNDNKNKKENI
jgi:hypothetical protein